jgi:hypothetical protein
MPRGVPKAPRKKPLDETQKRIREAERRYASVGRENVFLDAEGLDLLVGLVEGGAGKKRTVLDEALKIGLRVMAQGQGVMEPRMEFEPAKDLGTVYLPNTPRIDGIGDNLTNKATGTAPYLVPLDGFFGQGVLGAPLLTTVADSHARPLSQTIAPPEDDEPHEPVEGVE